MAQSAIEVATENVLALAFEAREIPGLKDPVMRLFRSYSLTNDSLYRVYHGLTGDDIKNRDEPLWRDFCRHVDRRNKVVHSGRLVSEEDAEDSVSIAERMVPHFAQLVATLGVEEPSRSHDA